VSQQTVPSRQIPPPSHDEGSPPAYRFFCDGRWREASAGTFDDLNPWTGKVFATAARCGRSDAAEAVAAASAAFPAWSRTPPLEKARLIRRAAAIVDRRRDELAVTIAQETGGPLPYAQFQVALVVQFIEQAAGWVYLPAGDVLQSDHPGTTQTVVRRPLGVVASFTPWNGPAILGWRAVLAPIAAGNTVVVKPSELAPVSAGLQIGEIMEEAGFPAGVVNVLTHGPGEAGPIADEFFDNPAVRCINFIGSVPTGRMLAERAGATLKRSVMELGGYNPMIIMDDVDLDYAVRVAAFSAFFNQGQICLNARRILVHRSIHDEFARRLVEKAESLPTGDPEDPATVIGPLITPDAVQGVDARVREAVAKGARVLTGGTYDGPVYAPTVLADVPADVAMSCSETFGPVVIVQPFDTVDEAVEVANSTMYGLSSSVLSRDTNRAVEIGTRIQSGTVHINLPTVDDEQQAPIGGVRDSGWGRTGPYALHDFTDLIAMAVQSGERALPIP
jgi:acyl-CoA reductase-like NAD-dependent aldehyde dehydrogenase